MDDNLEILTREQEASNKRIGIAIVSFAAALLPWYFGAPVLGLIICMAVWFGLHLVAGVKIRWWG
jgi:hypothetical protein